jgi:hypothetical protein
VANQGQKNPPRKRQPTLDALTQAAQHEAQVERDAAKLWDAGGAADLTPALFRKLRPLLRKPIPDGYISEVSAGDGKPYPSKGIKSLQVQIDRMDNVLGEGRWDWQTKYLNDAGTLAEVEVWVLCGSERLFTRRARGGVDRGSTAGNTHKGTETNAAKLAFARAGVGHEVYIGITDLDPDVSEDASKEQAKGPAANPTVLVTVSADDAAKLRDVFDRIPGDAKQKARALKVKLGAMGVTGVGSVNQALAKLTPAQAAELDGWLAEQSEPEQQKPAGAE